MSDLRTCPSCADAVGPTGRFCANCGAPLAAPTPDADVAGGGERRRLTILFCDLVGSTALSEDLDPEDLGEAVLTYQEMGRAVVLDFGGHVAQYLGDGLLAYFGYPRAHEDDAERAALAGLALLHGIDDVNRRVFPDGRTRLQARVGIHTGPAVVGAMGSADRSDTSVFGSTPNIAARLEAFALPGTVVVSDDVRSGLGDRFQVVDLGTPELRGIARPIRAWEVRSVGARAPRSQVSQPTAMVGRDRELQHLVACAERARAGTPTHVVVSAEPGVGKSRLVQAFYDEVQAGSAPAVWLEGQCSELSRSSPFAPVVALLRRVLGLEPSHRASERIRLLTDALSVLGADGPAAAHAIGKVLDIDVPLPPGTTPRGGSGAEAQRRRALDALVAWVHALAHTRLVVVAVEDLHWADPTTLELLGLLAEAPAGLHILSLHTTRPGTPHLCDPERVEELTLDSLPPAESELLARLLAHERGLPPEVIDAIARRGDGVPLFIEELVASADSTIGTDPDSVPSSLQALLAARLDALGEARPVVQAAAVLGRKFPEALIAAVAGRPAEELRVHLETLSAAGLITSRPTASGISHTFRHALIQDAAYESLLRRQRRSLHAAAAEALTTRFATTSVDTPEIVAFHLARAGSALEAAAWFERAGRRAAERAALSEARTHFEEGAALLEAAEPSTDAQRRLLSLNILLANTLMGSSGIGSEVTFPIWHRAVELAQETGDAEDLTAALNGLAVYHLDRGEQDEAERYVRWQLEVAEQAGSRVAALRGQGTLGLIRLYQGRAAETIDHIDTALSLSEEGDFFTVTFGMAHDEETYFYSVGSWARWWLGHPDAALAMARQCLDCAQSIPSSLSQAMGRHALAMAHHLRREPEAALAVAQENLTFCRSLGLPFWAGASQLIAGTQLARLNDASAAAMVAEALDRLTETGNLSGGSLGMSMLAEANLRSGRAEEALEATEVGLAAGELLQQPFCDTELHALRGEALLELGRRDDAIEALRQSLAVGSRAGAASASLQAARVLAPVLAEDDPTDARAVLSEALAAMHDGADTPDQRAVRAALQDLAVGT